MNMADQERMGSLAEALPVPERVQAFDPVQELVDQLLAKRLGVTLNSRTGADRWQCELFSGRAEDRNYHAPPGNAATQFGAINAAIRNYNARTDGGPRV